jgi:hypothetical protein
MQVFLKESFETLAAPNKIYMKSSNCRHTAGTLQAVAVMGAVT